MINTEINNIWDYLLSNKILSDSLSETRISGSFYFGMNNRCSKPLDLQTGDKYGDTCKLTHGMDDTMINFGSAHINKPYGIKMHIDNNNSGINLINPITGIINLIYYTNISKPTVFKLNIINNYRYIENEKNLGIKFDENLETIFKNLINNLPNQNLTNIQLFTKTNIINDILIIKNKPINAIIYIEDINTNYNFTFPIGSNIILIIYNSYVNCTLAFNNDTDIVCPPEKICSPEKICPINYIPYIFIIILIIIVMALAILLILTN